MTRRASALIGGASIASERERGKANAGVRAGDAQHHSVPEHNFKKLLARAALPPIRIHDLRHTAGTLMLAQSVPAPEVSRVLGHASVDIAHRLYAHAVSQVQQQALAAMERILQGR